MLNCDQQVEVQKLFLRHYSALRAFVFSILPDAAAADDIVQETFLVASEHSSEFELGSNFFAWVCTIARHRVLAERRKYAKYQLAPDVVEALLAESPTQPVDNRRLDVLAVCMQRLPPRMHEMLRLRHMTGLGPGEIAAQLSRTLNSVKVGLSKARVLLRGCVERELRREDVR